MKHVWYISTVYATCAYLAGIITTVESRLGTLVFAFATVGSAYLVGIMIEDIKKNEKVEE